MHKTENHIHLFKGYLQGALSQKEELTLIKWINDSDANFREFKEYVHQNQFILAESPETSLAWNRFSNKILMHNKQYFLSRFNTSLLKVAAIFVVALLSGFFLHMLINNNTIEPLQNEIIVANGDKAQVILSDGTVIHLNAGTQLKYPSIFSTDSRKVFLTGEAFFDVSAEPTRQFIVETPAFDVQVTGTAFNLNTYPDDDENSVTLHSGAVTVVNSDVSYTLNPGEKYVFNSKSQESDVVKANIKKSFLWKDDIIVIEDRNLIEVSRILERRFNVKIVIAREKFSRIRYSGQLGADKSLDEILKMIKETAPVEFNYRMNATKDVITIE